MPLYLNSAPIFSGIEEVNIGPVGNKAISEASWIHSDADITNASVVARAGKS